VRFHDIPNVQTKSGDVTLVHAVGVRHRLGVAVAVLRDSERCTSVQATVNIFAVHRDLSAAKWTGDYKLRMNAIYLDDDRTCACKLLGCVQSPTKKFELVSGSDGQYASGILVSSPELVAATVPSTIKGTWADHDAFP